MQYTEDQKKAIEARHRNILVAAAAGSGKTRVLVDRIIAQLLARECSVDEMLIVTFTNAAATEMRERIDKALQQKLLETDTQLDFPVLPLECQLFPVLNEKNTLTFVLLDRRLHRHSHSISALHY